ncbi:hypothetical protein PM082_002251 [Marasmius tenuissimus]|nr:hypothetical protein PM082_002251 [Marasmius tenuissimus]
MSEEKHRPDLDSRLAVNHECLSADLRRLNAPFWNTGSRARIVSWFCFCDPLLANLGWQTVVTRDTMFNPCKLTTLWESDVINDDRGLNRWKDRSKNKKKIQRHIPQPSPYPLFLFACQRNHQVQMSGLRGDNLQTKKAGSTTLPTYLRTTSSSIRDSLFACVAPLAHVCPADLHQVIRLR